METLICHLHFRMGFPRMESEERAHIIPTLLAALEGKPASHQVGDTVHRHYFYITS